MNAALTWDELSYGANHSERGDLIYQHRNDLAPVEYWRGVAEAWQDCERQALTKKEWRELWTGGDPAVRAEYVMTDDERRRLAELPDRVQVFRGHWVRLDESGAYGNEEGGLSWTLDEDIAHWFAMRRAAMTPSAGFVGFVVSGWVKRERILALFDARAEDEIVVLPKYVKGRSRDSADLDRCKRYAALMRATSAEANQPPHWEAS